MLPWTIVYKLVWGDMFSFFLSMYLSVELLGHTAILLFTLLRKCQTFSKVAVPTYIPMSDGEEFQFLHILMGVKWYHCGGCPYF